MPMSMPLRYLSLRVLLKRTAYLDTLNIPINFKLLICFYKSSKVYILCLFHQSVFQHSLNLKEIREVKNAFTDKILAQ